MKTLETPPQCPPPPGRGAPAEPAPAMKNQLTPAALAPLPRSRTINKTGLLLATALTVVALITAPVELLPLKIALPLLATLWGALHHTGFRYPTPIFCAALLLEFIYRDSIPAPLATLTFACAFFIALTTTLSQLALLALTYCAGDLLTFNPASPLPTLEILVTTLALFIGLPLIIRGILSQKRALAQEYETFREQVAESNRALARELHDTVARHISVIGLTTHRALATTAIDEKDEALTKIEKSTHKALADLRLLIRATRGAKDATNLPQTPAASVRLDRALAEAKESLAAQGFTLDDRITITSSDLPEGVHPTIYKIIQEIRHNAEKYAAPGGTISATVKPSLTGITIMTSNPVRPSPPAKKRGRSPGTGYGLVGISERIKALGGTIRYGETEGIWKLTIHLPLVTA